MTVQELIEALENFPPDCPVVADDVEVSEVVFRTEIYCNEDHIYREDSIVKLY